MHYPDNKGQELAVVYLLHNMKQSFRIRIKTLLPLDKPEIDSITGIFATANFMERETYDFFGIIFKGHPNLKRILNVDEMTYFPLRKEYPLEEKTRKDKDDSMFGR
jgi:NADH-quinone oxidoreductase subunit C